MDEVMDGCCRYWRGREGGAFVVVVVVVVVMGKVRSWKGATVSDMRAWPKHEEPVRYDTAVGVKQSFVGSKLPVALMKLF